MKKLITGCLAIILILISTIVLCSCARTITLYFASIDEDGQAYLVKESREVEDTGAGIYKTVIEELIKGPASDSLYPTVPPDSVVNSVKLSEGLAIVDFNIRIITNFEDIPHSSTTEALAIYSIVNTLTEFEEIEIVKITIEGTDSGEVDGIYVQDFWGHIGIYENFYRNVEIIKDNG